jgi:hypothetical protein
MYKQDFQQYMYPSVMLISFARATVVVGGVVDRRKFNICIESILLYHCGRGAHAISASSPPRVAYHGCKSTQVNLNHRHLNHSTK